MISLFHYLLLRSPALSFEVYIKSSKRIITCTRPLSLNMLSLYSIYIYSIYTRKYWYLVHANAFFLFCFTFSQNISKKNFICMWRHCHVSSHETSVKKVSNCLYTNFNDSNKVNCWNKHCYRTKEKRELLKRSNMTYDEFKTRKKKYNSCYVTRETTQKYSLT